MAITTLCLEGCEAECGGCAGTIHRCRLAPAGATRWLLVVADERTTLLGHFTSRHVTAVCTEQPLLVELAMAYIQQSTTLAILGSELAGRLEGSTLPKSRRMLDGLVPAGDFLAHMRELKVPRPERRDVFPRNGRNTMNMRKNVLVAALALGGVAFGGVATSAEAPAAARWHR
ncbi:hypothetical protein [Rhodanobacter lindaniclasticus]